MSKEEPFNIKVLRFLVVDDHAPIRKAMKKVLTGLGAEHIQECFDGVDAIEHLQKNRVDMVLCDIYMRKKKGFEVLEHIRSRSIASDMPFLMVSGEGSKDDIVKTSDLGADGYVIKPFQAEELEEKILKTLRSFFDPSPLLRTLRLGDKAMLDQDYPEAFAVFMEAMELDPQSARAAHSAGIVLYYANQFEKAVQHLEKCAEKFPDYYKNYMTLANMMLKHDKHEEAIRYIGLELDVNPRQLDRQIQLGRLLLAAKKPEKAVEHFRQALIESKSSAAALLGMGHAHAKKEDLDKAFYYFKRLRRANPNDTSSLKAAVQAALQSNFAKKGENFLKDETKNPHQTNYSAQVYLAKFYMNFGKFDEAISVLKPVQTKAPEHLECLRTLVQALFQKRDYKACITQLEHLCSVENSLKHISMLGECYSLAGDYPGAIRAYHRALVLKPKDPRVLYAMAKACMASKQVSKAFHIFWYLYSTNFQAAECHQQMQKCYQHTIGRRRQKIRSAS